MMGNLNGYPDLVYIKTAGTGSGKAEVHWLDADSLSGNLHSSASWFNASDAANGSFSMSRLDGSPDLTYIKTANTGSGKVEVHYASSVNNYGSWTWGAASWFSAADAANGKFRIGAN